MNIFIKLKNLDRRWVFLFVALSVIVPLLFPFALPVVPTKSVANLHKFIENTEALPEGTRCFLSFDFDPASEPELKPSAVAILVHMFRRNLKPICGANWPVGGEMAEVALVEAANAYMSTYDDMKAQGKLAPGCKPIIERGVDYVNLGYKTGAIIHVKALCNDFMYPYPQDRDGNSTAEMAIFANPDGRRFAMSDVGLIISFTAGTGGIETFISMAGEHKRPMAAGCTSVNIPRFTTYLQSGQLVGMTGGLPGAAEYETLIERPGKGCAGMTPQSIAHLVIMLFIIFGNLAYIAEQRNEAKKKG
jgi:hypothetical protein